MKAVQIHEFGDAGRMKAADVPAPDPGAGQARVRLGAAGLNFIDIYQRKGLYPVPLPYTLGLEGAGAVEALGPETEGLREGDRVAFAMAPGAYAAAAVVPAWQLVPVPAGLTLEAAAAVMLQGMTAHYLTHSTYALRPGDTALVHAAAGGVGLLLIQLAKKRGARVVGTVSTEEKAELARKAGADHVVRYTEENFSAETARFTDGAGVEVVYDSVGADTFEQSLNCLKPRGMLALYGQASGPVGPFDPQILHQKGSLFLTRPSLAHYALNREELLQRSGDLFGWMERGELQGRVDRTFPLEEAAEAHKYMEARRTKGKVLLVP